MPLKVSARPGKGSNSSGRVAITSSSEKNNTGRPGPPARIFQMPPMSASWPLQAFSSSSITAAGSSSTLTSKPAV